MTHLTYVDTQICEPQDQAMQDWLKNLNPHYGTKIPCGDLKPASIDASDEYSDRYIRVTWPQSNIAVFYVLQREEFPNQYTYFNLPHIYYCYLDICRYNDHQVEQLARYYYRVKGCISETNCSEYTIRDRGTLARPIGPFTVPSILLPQLFD